MSTATVTAHSSKWFALSHQRGQFSCLIQLPYIFCRRFATDPNEDPTKMEWNANPTGSRTIAPVLRHESTTGDLRVCGPCLGFIGDLTGDQLPPTHASTPLRDEYSVPCHCFFLAANDFRLPFTFIYLNRGRMSGQTANPLTQIGYNAFCPSKLYTRCAGRPTTR